MCIVSGIWDILYSIKYVVYSLWRIEIVYGVEYVAHNMQYIVYRIQDRLHSAPGWLMVLPEVREVRCARPGPGPGPGLGPGPGGRKSYKSGRMINQPCVEYTAHSRMDYLKSYTICDI